MTLVDILILIAAALAFITVAGIVTLTSGARARQSTGAFWLFDEQTHTRVP